MRSEELAALRQIAVAQRDVGNLVDDEVRDCPDVIDREHICKARHVRGSNLDGRHHFAEVVLSSDAWSGNSDDRASPLAVISMTARAPLGKDFRAAVRRSIRLLLSTTR